MKNKLKKATPIKAFIKGIEVINSDSCTASIELVGNKRVIIEEATGILEYENDKVRVNSNGCIIIVDGTKLTLESYSDKIIVVDGKISGVSLG